MLRIYKLLPTIAVAVLFEFSVVSCLWSQQKTAERSSVEPAIQVQSVNVVIDMIVTDRHGHHVPGLTASDFTIYEDGVPQKIVGFTPSLESASNTPAPAASKEGEIPKTISQPSQPASAPEPHLLTVVLDLADNRPANTKSSADAILGYLDKTLASGDYVAIFYIDQGLHMALPFTNDLQKARETLKGIETRRPPGTFSGTDRATTQSEINDLYRQAHPETELGAIAGDPPPATGPPLGNNLS